ncbi:MAG: hypothetical protein Q8R24_04070 [Legionellaceae bacterium]|nr:hypothetical protein [Legionellaceae bacterium]
MTELIKAEAGMKHSVIYTDSFGNYFRYFGGTWAWRNHNPGNMRPSDIGIKYGQIGVAYNFAVFPSNDAGHQALLELLKVKYGNSSIDEMLEKYAPSKENDTIKYKKYLHKYTGINDDRKIKTFTDLEFEKLWHGIEQYEGYKEGEIVQIYKITHVKQEKHAAICAFYVDNEGWFTKEKCIELAKKNKIELEICISCLGHPYLKAASHSKFQPKLRSLVEKKPGRQ